MKKTSSITLLLAAVLLITSAVTARAQIISGPHGSEDMKIGVAGYSYRNFSIDETLSMLQSMDVKYLSIKDWWLPLDSTKEQMDAFKKKCASYGVDGYILGPIYMHSKEEVDRAFAYTQRYGIDMFIGVPDYDLIDYVIGKVAETGIRVAIHTHGPDGAAFPSIFMIMELVKDPSLGVGCCLDMGHSVRRGEDIAQTSTSRMRLLLPRLARPGRWVGESLITGRSSRPSAKSVTRVSSRLNSRRTVTTPILESLNPSAISGESWTVLSKTSQCPIKDQDWRRGC